MYISALTFLGRVHAPAPPVIGRTRMGIRLRSGSDTETEPRGCVPRISRAAIVTSQARSSAPRPTGLARPAKSRPA